MHDKYRSPPVIIFTTFSTVMMIEIKERVVNVMEVSSVYYTARILRK